MRAEGRSFRCRLWRPLLPLFRGFRYFPEPRAGNHDRAGGDQAPAEQIEAGLIAFVTYAEIIDVQNDRAGEAEPLASEESGGGIQADPGESMVSISRAGRASSSNCSIVHWLGALSGRQRRKVVPWRNLPPVAWS